MRIVVLGGGVVGVTVAYQLQKDGHDVAVIERHSEVAADTSWGNAGMVAPGHSFVWSSPAAPKILLKSLFLKDQALRFKLSADPRLYAWSLRFLRECTSEKARRNTLRKHRLATYAQTMLDQVVAAEAIDYDRSRRGIFYFYRSAQALAAGTAKMKVLESAGQKIELLDRAGALALDPALAAAGDTIVGGVYCPTDETGDPAKFTRALAGKITARGGAVHAGTTIAGIETEGDAVVRIVTDRGDFKGDAYVLAMGSYAPLLARRIGVRLPIYPIKGYSLTIPIGNRPHPPNVASVDEHNLVAISRFGDRLRVTATAEFAGYDKAHRPSDFAFMKRVTQSIYPEGADYDRAEMWAGLRPMTPSNLPILGRQRYRNLWINAGHGHMGWTMSHGTARMLADLIGGRTPAIPLDGMEPA
jgi:D-amino-acid dehydrogenase